MKPDDQRKGRIRMAFGAARGYEAKAQAQARAAEFLAALVRREMPRFAGAVLEVGCGTGLLSRVLLPALRPASWLCTDLAPEMVLRTAHNLAGIAPAVRLAVMDAETPAARPGFDLVVSGMALQWATDLQAALVGLWSLLRPGGLLAFSLPGAGTFAAWRAAHEALGLACGLPDFPEADALAALLPGPGRVFEQRLALDLPRALEFPRLLKALGGHVPRPDHTPLSPAAFRSVLARLDQAQRTGTRLEYRILHALAFKPVLE